MRPRARGQPRARGGPACGGRDRSATGGCGADWRRASRVPRSHDAPPDRRRRPTNGRRGRPRTALRATSALPAGAVAGRDAERAGRAACRAPNGRNMPHAAREGCVHRPLATRRTRRARRTRGIAAGDREWAECAGCQARAVRTSPARAPGRRGAGAPARRGAGAPAGPAEPRVAARNNPARRAARTRTDDATRDATVHYSGVNKSPSVRAVP